jgi:hypothetical protein
MSWSRQIWNCEGENNIETKYLSSAKNAAAHESDRYGNNWKGREEKKQEKKKKKTTSES